MKLPQKRLVVAGHYGIGDCLHQRAIVRELMKTASVTLQTFYTAMYHDLAGLGLQLASAGRVKPRIKDAGNKDLRLGLPAASRRIGYSPEAIRKHGSILAAQFASVGLKMPDRPDFSLPVKPEWRAAARRLIASWQTGGKPIMVYRPIVLNKVWEAPARSPDVFAYATLFRAIRDKFFVVSVADLTQGDERIVSVAAGADAEYHHGELPFETLAGLFAEASLVFGSPGFAPILAQAVGTPVISVYGANESYRTTLAPGAHLAPTLAIEPMTPCEHFARTCGCDKTIDLMAGVARVTTFAEEHGRAKPRVLVFGTTYVDTPEKLRLTRQWADLHSRLNPSCDFLLVDSASPLGPLDAVAPGAEVFTFPDNIGHLARGGRDGWGRAFCQGLDMAVSRGYDYVAHIEGDSLFKLPVEAIVREMVDGSLVAVSVPVAGTKRREVGWVETGLMLFDCGYLAGTAFTSRYDWKTIASGFPERVIFDLLGKELQLMTCRAERGDRGQITVENVADLDWVTHCRAEVMDRFFDAAHGVREIVREPVRLNFGCGANRLDGWENFDSEVDIGKPLPFPDGYADVILAEHCVEHVDYERALAFFRECRRVLKPGGVVRICVPSLESVMLRADEAYCGFVHKCGWAATPDARGAMDAILHKHGHKAPWTASLLRASLFLAGFEDVVDCQPGISARAGLTAVDGHGKVIGEHFNWIESAICEGVARQSAPARAPKLVRQA